MVQVLHHQIAYSPPFHYPQHWKDGLFENVALCDLGYVFILGHSSSGHFCPEDGNLFGDCRIMVIQLNGVFELCVRFCRCQGACSEHEQLFCHRLFLSTFDRPEPPSLWMFWIIMELMPWNAKLQPSAFSKN
jgi:CxC2 like cysteine cluster associated with KDZ transposases